MTRTISMMIGVVLLGALAQAAAAAEPPDLLELVDPFVGTGGHGHTYPGATVPFGMVQVSPDTHSSGWDWCSGYHYSDRSIMGFSQTHLSGTGVGDMLDVLLMPSVGPLQLEAGTREDPDAGYPRSAATIRSWAGDASRAGPRTGTSTSRRASRGLDGQVHAAPGFRYHSTFSLWDTYRAAHPLYCLVQRERTRDLAQTLVRMAVESPTGQMPVWPLANDETNCMIGFHSASVLAEAWLKGIRGFDLETAFERLKTMAAKADYRGLGDYARLGYVPSDREAESVSKTLEYSYDDWCIAQLARALGRKDDEQEFLRRAGSWRNLFDPATGFARPRLASGSFASPFDPARNAASADWHDYTEGNAWQYSFAAQHDPEGYVRALGGREALVRKLDALFATPLDAKAAGLPIDVSGLIGQYAHGNEPSHHLAYLYTYAGAPWKTQERVRGILDTMYGDTPEGLAGNEDCGQMSAWYVLSALGLYPVNPASATYVVTSPLFDRATLDLGEGRRFTLSVERTLPADVYVQSATLGGKALPRAWITHEEVMAAGELHVVLGRRPNPGWATAVAERPPSMTGAVAP